MRYQFAIDIDRPVETVWEFSNDFFNAPRLGGQAIVFRQTSPGGPGLGATYEGRMMILGFETRVHGSFTEWEPLRAMTASMSARPLKWARLRETYEPTPTGTRMVRAMELDLRFPLNILAPILMPFVIRRWQHANASIKRILESIPDEEVRASTEPVAAIGPSVHRTVMFTDIVGSTQLIGVIGDAAWRDLRRWHDATLRTTFERHHGRELDHAGAGFSVAFESAGDGVSCAVELERTVIGHRRTAGFGAPLRRSSKPSDTLGWNVAGPQSASNAGRRRISCASHASSRIRWRCARPARPAPVLAVGPAAADARRGHRPERRARRDLPGAEGGDRPPGGCDPGGRTGHRQDPPAGRRRRARRERGVHVRRHHR